MAANGNLIFQDTNKATFVGANSNVVIDTVHASFGVGVDVNGPTSNLHVVGNAYVTSNLEVGTANLFVDTVNSRVGVGTTSPIGTLSIVRDTVVAGPSTYQRGMFYKDGKLQITPPDLYSGYPLDGDFLTTSRYVTDGSTDYTGAALGVAYDTVTGSKSALYFKTAVSGSSLTEKMRITGDGNVGIGEDNPPCKLTVGDDNVSVNSSGGVLGIRQKGDTASDGIALTSSHANSTRMYKDANGHFNLYNIGGGTFTLENGTGDVVISGYLKTGNPAFYARKTTSTATGSYIVYNAVDVNSGSCYDSSTGIFTCPVAGTYTFTWGAIGNTTSTVYRLYIRVNGNNINGGAHLRADHSATGNEYNSGDRSAILNLAANDEIRIFFAADDSTSSLYGSSYTHFQGYLISRT